MKTPKSPLLRCIALFAFFTLVACDDEATGPSKGTDGTDPGDGGDATDTTPSLFDISYTRADTLADHAPGTIFIVEWSVELDDLTAASIHFGTDTAYGRVAPVDLNAPNHRTLLLGLKPDRTYHFQVTVQAGDETYNSEDIAVETGPAVNLVTLDTFDVRDDDAREPGFILMTVGDMAVIVDPDGEIVWWYQSTQGELFTARMSFDAQNMWLAPITDAHGGHAGPLERVTMDTLTTQIYDDVSATHDITPVRGDTMAFVNDSHVGTCSDSVVEIDNSGATAEVFVAGDYLLSCHINALRFDAVEYRYTASNRLSTVYVFDSAGQVDWLLSDLVSNTTYGEEQHGHHLLDDSMLIFANNADMGRSAAIEYSRTDGEILYQYNGKEFTNTMGNVQRLPGGNTLVTYSNAGVIHEASPDEEAVLVIETAPIGGATWRSELYGPPDDLLI